MLWTSAVLLCSEVSVQGNVARSDHGCGSGEGRKPLPGHRQLAPCCPPQMVLCHTVPKPQGSARGKGYALLGGERERGPGLDPRTSLCEASDCLESLF